LKKKNEERGANRAFSVVVSFSRDHNIDCDLRLEVVSGSDHILLVGLGGCELKAVPPNNRLLVVGVSPERMEHAIRANGDVAVVAEKTSAKSVPAVYWMGSY